MVFSVGALLQVSLRAVPHDQKSLAAGPSFPFYCRIIALIATTLLLPCNRIAGSTELGTMEFIRLPASGYEVGRCRISRRFSSSRTISNCAVS
jgi:hypothetical protein